MSVNFCKTYSCNVCQRLQNSINRSFLFWLMKSIESPVKYFIQKSFLIQSLALLKDFKYIRCNDGTLTTYYKVVVRKFYPY